MHFRSGHLKQVHYGAWHFGGPLVSRDLLVEIGGDFKRETPFTQFKRDKPNIRFARVKVLK